MTRLLDRTRIAPWLRLAALAALLASAAAAAAAAEEDGAMLVLAAAQEEAAPAAPTEEARPDDSPQPKEIRAKLTAVRAALDAREPTPEFLSEEMKKATALRGEAGACQQYGEER